jgi:hypothetical protein
MIPLNHSFTGTPILILSIDPAWNQAKIDADNAAIRAAIKAAEAGPDPDPGEPLAPCPWASLADHPVAQYHRGESRYDKSTVEAWLLPSVRPSMFVLRRLSWSEFGDYKRLRVDLKDRHAATKHAIRYGVLRIADLEGIDWPDRDRDRDRADAPPLTEAQLEKLRNRLGDDVLEAIAAAIYLASEVPTPAEKKA